MIIKCVHGFFMFFETQVGQAADFIRLFGFDLVPRDDYFTFASLLDIPKYSLKGKMIGDYPALKTFEGEVWEVFEANGVVYNFATDLIVPISSLTLNNQVNFSGDRFVSPGLLLPGSLNQGGDRIKGYSAWFNRENSSWYYSEVNYV